MIKVVELIAAPIYPILEIKIKLTRIFKNRQENEKKHATFVCQKNQTRTNTTCNEVD